MKKVEADFFFYIYHYFKHQNNGSVWQGPMMSVLYSGNVK